MRGPFQNEPGVDFNAPENREAMYEALKQVETQLGQRYPLVIGGERRETGQWITSTNPGNLDEVVGEIAKGQEDNAVAAIEAAWEAFEGWRRIPAEGRAGVLFRMAALLRRRRLELTAWLAHEVDKTWEEGDGEVAEAIDFCEWYGREVLRLSGPTQLAHIPEEANELRYVPLGVGIIIPPWNFGCAILTGMTMAAVGAGNAVVLKPSSNTPIIAYKLFELMEEAGVPAGVVNLLPGGGSEIGDTLVDHPRTRFIAFTGSKDVGIRIYERAAKVQPGQQWLKRVTAEMGGKDTIIVDRETDIDLAVQGIVASAFGFQGQKCSAGSRVVVHADVYDEVVQKVVARTEETITVGPVANREHTMGAVVDRKQYESILNYIEIGAREGRLVLGGDKAPGNGYFIQPTIFADVPPDARLSTEEIFGPVLAIIKAKDFDEALQIANNTEYGLTGSVYTRNRELLERARLEFHVGNLYFNRKCTGSLVGIHPFGGLKLSGTNAKTGGPDYLLNFLEAKAVSEQL